MCLQPYGGGERLVYPKQRRHYVCLDLGGVLLSQLFPFPSVYFRQIPVVNALILHRTPGNANTAGVSSYLPWCPALAGLLPKEPGGSFTVPCVCVRACVCMHVPMWVPVCACAFTCVCTYPCVCARLYMCVHVPTCVCVCVYACACVFDPYYRWINQSVVKLASCLEFPLSSSQI